MKPLTIQGSCIIRIQGAYNYIKSAEKRLADYILNNPSEVLGLTIMELCEKTNSSYATVNRFCKKIGYHGYKELKQNLLMDISNGNNDTFQNDFALTRDMNCRDVCENVYNFAFKVLKDSLAIIDPNKIDEVTTALIKANKILFLGTGNSGISAKYAYSKFFRIGFTCLCEEDSTLAMLHIALLGAGDVLFVISSSGRSSRIVEAVKAAKSRGVTIVNVGDFAVSPLSKLANYNLFTTHRSGNLFMNIDMPLTIGQITLLDLLYMNCCVKIGNFANNNYETTKVLADAEKIK